MPDEAITAAKDLKASVDNLSKQVESLSKSVKRGRVVNAVLSVVCVITLGLVIAVTVSVRYSVHQASCVRDYTNQNADRNNAIFPLSQAKNDAQDAFVTSLTADDKAETQRLFQTYVKAVRAYQSAQAANPLPLAPRSTC